MFGSRSRIKDLQDRNEYLAHVNRRLRAELADAEEKAAVAEARVLRFASDRIKVSRQDAAEMANLGDEIKTLRKERDEAIAHTRLQETQLAKLQAANEKHYQDLAAKGAS